MNPASSSDLLQLLLGLMRPSSKRMSILLPEGIKTPRFQRAALCPHLEIELFPIPSSSFRVCPAKPQRWHFALLEAPALLRGEPETLNPSPLRVWTSRGVYHALDISLSLGCMKETIETTTGVWAAIDERAL